MSIDNFVIRRSDSSYPDPLRTVLPDAELCCVGDRSLLAKRAIGICGSRGASEEALIWAYKFGAEASNHGLVVVSGYARGVDRQAHKGALESGGSTIAVLPEGINNFRMRRELKPLARLDGNFLAVSMFEPDAVWKSWRAMERNKLIVGLSVALFVVEAKETGGTIDAAMQCVRQKKKLWAISYSADLPGREGNRLLLQDAAIPLKRLGDLRKALEMAMSDSDESVTQLALGLAGV